MKNLLGANWRTSLSGIVTLLAAAIYANPASVSFLPPDIAKNVVGIAGLIALASGGAFALVAKDAAVTGSGPGATAAPTVPPVALPPSAPAPAQGPILGRKAIGTLAILGILFIQGCAFFQSAENFAKTPKGEALLSEVSSTALTAGLDAAEHNDVGAIVSGVQGAAAILRTLEGTPKAGSQSAIVTAIVQGANVPAVKAAIAPVVAKAVAKATALGIPASQAVEAAAQGFDALAAEAPAAP